MVVVGATYKCDLQDRRGVETVENWHNVYDAIYEMDGEEMNFH